MALRRMLGFALALTAGCAALAACSSSSGGGSSSPNKTTIVVPPGAQAVCSDGSHPPC